MPAICSTFLGTRAATMPAPRGAGISRTVTDPHLPVTCASVDTHCLYKGHKAPLTPAKCTTLLQLVGRGGNLIRQQ